MLEQYFGMKAKHPEAILLSRVGDFYEAYGEDAEVIARALQIALTSKEAGAGKRVAMAGVPHHALAQYLARLVQQRFIVALAEQLEVPQPNRLVRREVVRLVTPGTLIEEQLLDGKQNNYLAAIAVVGETFALAYADVSTSYSRRDGDRRRKRVRRAACRAGAHRPDRNRRRRSGGSCAQRSRRRSRAIGARLATPSLGLVETRERETLRRLFDGRIAGDSPGARCARRLSSSAPESRTASGDSSEPQLYRRQQFLAHRSRDAQASRADARAGAEPARDAARDARRLRDVDGIANARALDTRAARRSWSDSHAPGRGCGAADEHARRDAMREILRGAFDLERIAQKVRFRRATPRDLASLRRTLEMLRPLRQLAYPGDGASASSASATSARCSTTCSERSSRIRRRSSATAARYARKLAPSWPSASRCGPTRVRNSPNSEQRERERTGIKTLESEVRQHVRLRNRGQLRATRRRFRRSTCASRRLLTASVTSRRSSRSSSSRFRRRRRVKSGSSSNSSTRFSNASRPRVERLLDGRRRDRARSTCLRRSHSAPPSAATSDRRSSKRALVAIEDGRHPVMEAILHAQLRSERSGFARSPSSASFS